MHTLNQSIVRFLSLRVRKNANVVIYVLVLALTIFQALSRKIRTRWLLSPLFLSGYEELTEARVDV